MIRVWCDCGWSFLVASLPDGWDDICIEQNVRVE
jgi:hypothetical protein